MVGSLAAWATVAESARNDRVWGGDYYYNRARIDNTAHNVQTVAWTGGPNRSEGVQVRQWYQSADTLCASSSWLYDTVSSLNLTLYGCSSGNFYSRGVSAFWQSPYSDYYYFNTYRTPALTF